MRRRRLLAAPLLAAAFPARAQRFDRPLRLVVPFAPGGGTDIAARALAEPFGARLGQPVVVENRPGANGQIGAQAVLSAPADGYTIFTPTSAQFSAAPALGVALPYDPDRDFTPVGLMALVPLVLTAYPGSGWKSLADMLQAARAAPGKYAYASAGVGGTNHLVMEMIAAAAGGLDLVHVPYRGAGPAQTDLYAGRVQLLVDSVAAALPAIRDGRARALAVASTERLSWLADVPTLIAQGVALEYYGWVSLDVRSPTPPAQVAALNQALLTSLRDPLLQSRFETLGFIPPDLSPAATRAFVLADRAKLAAIVRARNIRPE
ncbi:MAG: tripartite tricarboxylate transporter substrate binding protein [Acetobacteraceae bacterium]|nr:tripartite tricarboxylate transporter substrate binding protein [Acetobacteraceae bacterium]